MWNLLSIGSGSGVYRPSASSGTITSGALAYDVDAYPWATASSRAVVTGSAVAGTPDFDIVTYNAFPARAKATFSNCRLQVVVSAVLTAQVFSVVSGGGHTTVHWVTPSLDIEYRVDGSTWVKIAYVNGGGHYATLFAADAANDVSILDPDAPFDVTDTVSKSVYTVNIPATSFAVGIDDINVRFRLGTCKNSTDTSKQSSGSYQIWDIRADVT